MASSKWVRVSRWSGAEIPGLPAGCDACGEGVAQPGHFLCDGWNAAEAWRNGQTCAFQEPEEQRLPSSVRNEEGSAFEGWQKAEAWDGMDAEVAEAIRDNTPIDTCPQCGHKPLKAKCEILVDYTIETRGADQEWTRGEVFDDCLSTPVQIVCPGCGANWNRSDDEDSPDEFELDDEGFLVSLDER